jgi:ADP-glucose pyrophosphorylase
VVIPVGTVMVHSVLGGRTFVSTVKIKDAVLVPDPEVVGTNCDIEQPLVVKEDSV